MNIETGFIVAFVGFIGAIVKIAIVGYEEPQMTTHKITKKKIYTFGSYRDIIVSPVVAVITWLVNITTNDEAGILVLSFFAGLGGILALNQFINVRDLLAQRNDLLDEYGSDIEDLETEVQRRSTELNT